MRGELTPAERAIFRRLSTPEKIQDFLDELPINFESAGFTYRSPREVLRAGEAHCLEGALLAAAALWFNQERPLLLDLRTAGDDQDHVVALFRRGGYWGAISKTNHAVLRWRDPIYRSARELALSYFHEYFLNHTGEKTLREYSRPFDLARWPADWVTASENLDDLVAALDASPHERLLPLGASRRLRRASKVERWAGELVDWPLPPDSAL